MINEALLKNEELAVYKLRSLYSSYGYTQYKMSKFEEYDLYVRNKDFLISDKIITFTDTNGKLLALKPDVTLSIINHLGNKRGQVHKLYYNENVYRVSGESHRFKEIMQTGLECVGDIGTFEVCEVTALAIKSLKMIDEEYYMDISHAGLVEEILKENADEAVIDRIREYLYLKNEGGISALKEQGKLTCHQAEAIGALFKTYCSIEELEATLKISGERGKELFAQLKSVLEALKALELFEGVRINFSLTNNMGYYSGIVFKGYIKGIPTGVLSGGQYDSLMKKLKKDTSAIGFAVYLDSFERLNPRVKENDVDVFIVTDGNTDAVRLLKAVEEIVATGKSVLTGASSEGVRAGRIIDVEGREKV